MSDEALNPPPAQVTKPVLPEPNHITPAAVLRSDELFYSWLSVLRQSGIDMSEDAARDLLEAQAVI